MDGKIAVPVTVALPAGQVAPPPNAVECPACYAIVLETRLADHQATH